jgi:hypothetical protein
MMLHATATYGSWLYCSRNSHFSHPCPGQAV